MFQARTGLRRRRVRRHRGSRGQHKPGSRADRASGADMRDGARCGRHFSTSATDGLELGVKMAKGGVKPIGASVDLPIVGEAYAKHTGRVRLRRSELRTRRGCVRVLAQERLRIGVIPNESPCSVTLSVRWWEPLGRMMGAAAWHHWAQRATAQRRTGRRCPCQRGPRTRRQGWGWPERIHGSTGAGGQGAPRRLGRQQNTAVRSPWLSGGRARCAPGVSWRWTVCQTSPTRMVRCVFPCSSLTNTRRVQRCRLWLLTTCYELAFLTSFRITCWLAH